MQHDTESIKHWLGYLKQTGYHNAPSEEDFDSYIRIQRVEAFREGVKTRDGCYCVCHSPVSSRPVCEHCESAVEIAHRTGYQKGVEATIAQIPDDAIFGVSGNFKEALKASLLSPANNETIL